MKKLLIAGVVVIVLIAIAAFFLLSNLNSLVAQAIEKHGSKATQTSVRVSGVDISLRDGRGSIRGLQVASPEGFASRTAFSLDDITVALDTRSVRENPVVIEEIRIEAPVIHAEMTKTGASNIDELRKRVQANAGGATSGSGDAAGQRKRIRIKQIVFRKGLVEADASALGLGKRTISLPEIRLDDIGGASGAPPEEIAKVILTAVAAKAASAIAGSELDQLVKGKLGSSLGDKARGVLQRIGN